MKIFLSEEALSAIKDSHIFVDTCVLLDFATLKGKDQVEFGNKLFLFTKKGSLFVTIEPVVFEFYLGSSKSDLKIKKSYVGQLIKTVLPVRILNKENTEGLILQYGRYARKNVSYTDLCLAAAVKQFSDSLVLTRNYKDFPLKIFDCRALFTIHFNKDIRTYCFYGYRRSASKKKRKAIKNKNNIPF